MYESLACNFDQHWSYMYVHVIAVAASMHAHASYMCVLVWYMDVHVLKCNFSDECTPNLCVNGADCTDGVNGFSCSCDNGFTGTYCQNNIGKCMFIFAHFI